MSFLICKFELDEVILKWYKNLDDKIKVAFIISFFIGVISFLPFIVHHPFHDHGMRLPWVNPNDQVHHGRWFSYVLIMLFNNADLPVFTSLFCVALNVISGILIVRTWSSEMSAHKLTICVLLISIYPALLTGFYYTFASQIYSFALFFSALALFVSRKVSLLRISISSLLVMLAMASYQPAISFFATILTCFFIVKFIEKKGVGGANFEILKYEIIPRSFSIIVGLLLYRLSLEILNIPLNSHASQTIKLEDYFNRFIEVTIVSFKHLYLTQPELLTVLKMVLLIFVVLSAITLVVHSIRMKMGWSAPIIAISLLVLAIISTKLMYLISSNNGFYVYRYNYALGALYAFSVFICLQYVRGTFLRNIVLILSVFVVIKYTYSNLIRQSVIMKSQIHDLAIANRILMRIESLDELDYKKKYTLIRLGNYSNIRRELLQSKGHKSDLIGGGHMDFGDITAKWSPADIMRLLGSKVKWKYYGYTPGFRKKIKYAREHLIENRKLWPHSSSVFIHDDTIYVYMQ